MKMDRRRPRRRWDIPSHKVCFFASNSSDADVFSRRPESNFDKQDIFRSTPFANQHLHLKLPNIPSTTTIASITIPNITIEPPVNANNPNRMAPLSPKREPSLTPSDKMPNSRLRDVFHGKLASQSDSEDFDWNLKKTQACRSSHNGETCNCTRSYRQQIMMQMSKFRDSRICKAKRQVDVRRPQILFGSVVSNRTTCLRLAKVGFCGQVRQFRNVG